MPPARLDLAAMAKDPDLRFATVQGEGVRAPVEAFDHKLILRDAIRRLRAKFEYSPIGAYPLRGPVRVIHFRRSSKEVHLGFLHRDVFFERMFGAQYHF